LSTCTCNKFKGSFFVFHLLVSQANLPCIHLDREIIAVMVLTKRTNKI